MDFLKSYNLDCESTFPIHKEQRPHYEYGLATSETNQYDAIKHLSCCSDRKYWTVPQNATAMAPGSLIQVINNDIFGDDISWALFNEWALEQDLKDVLEAQNGSEEPYEYEFESYIV